jgi:hypothetical protein
VCAAAAGVNYYTLYTLSFDGVSYVQVPYGGLDDFLLFASSTYPADRLEVADAPPGSSPRNIYVLLQPYPSDGARVNFIPSITLYLSFSVLGGPDPIAVVAYCTRWFVPPTPTQLPTLTVTPTGTATSFPGSDPTVPVADTATAFARTPTNGPEQLTATVHHDMETATAEAVVATLRPIPQPQPANPTSRAGGVWERDPFHSGRVYMGGVQTAVIAFRDAAPPTLPQTCNFALPSMPDGMPVDQFGVVNPDALADAFCDVVERTTWARQVLWLASTLLVLFLLARYFVGVFRRGATGGD